MIKCNANLKLGGLLVFVARQSGCGVKTRRPGDNAPRVRRVDPLVVCYRLILGLSATGLAELCELTSEYSRHWPSQWHPRTCA